MYFDTHAHYDNPRFDADRRTLLERLPRQGISLVLNPGYDMPSSRMAVALADDHPFIYASVGFHPHDAKKMEETDLKMIKALAAKPKVVAIGETGLDFFRDLSPRDVQRDCFRKQIKLAKELKMPLVVHSREADEETMKILREEQAFSDIRILLHCYSGNKEMAKQYIKLGAMISIAGPITYKNARKSVEVVEEIPIEYLLIETDAPYLTPEPLRGKPNKAQFVEYTARRIAEIKGISYEETARITCENAKRFYGIT